MGRKDLEKLATALYRQASYYGHSLLSSSQSTLVRVVEQIAPLKILFIIH